MPRHVDFFASGIIQKNIIIFLQLFFLNLNFQRSLSLSENIVGTRTSNRLFNNVFDFFLLKIKFTANIVLLKELKREIQIAKLLFHGQNQLVLLIREIIRNQKKLSSEQDTVESDFAVP